jgi:hypothetical protein
MMMKRFIPICAVLLLLATGCNRILKELTEKDVDVANIEFASDDLPVYPAPEGSPAGTYNDFREEQTISLNDFEGAEELEKYNKEHIKSVSCDSVKILATSTNNQAGNIKNLVVDIKDAPNLTYTIAAYTLGTIYQDNEAKKFVEALMLLVLTSNSNNLSLSFSGQTNLGDEERLRLHISIKGIRVKVQMAT